MRGAYALAVVTLVLAILPGRAMDEGAPTLAALDAGIARRQAAIAAQVDESCSPSGVGRLLALMVDVDQFARGSFYTVCPTLAQDCNVAVAQRGVAVDVANRAKIKALLARYRWAALKACAPKAQHDAWLLVQHADEDVPFQRRVLAQMKDALLAGEADAVDYAYLYDRVAVHERRKQLFGTQGSCDGETWKADPIAGPAGLERRRHEMGMPWSTAEYQKVVDAMCKAASPK